jgi:peptide/nickel transport system permease protein
MKHMLRHPSLVIGLSAALVFALLGLLSLFWTPYPIEQIAVTRRFQGMGAEHWLGTDQLGRDMFSLIMSGTLTSFSVAAVGTLIGLGIGVPLGLAAAAWGGAVEWLVLRFSDLTFAFPSVIVAILMTTPLAYLTSLFLPVWRAAEPWPLPRRILSQRRDWRAWAMLPFRRGICCPIL